MRIVTRHRSQRPPESLSGTGERRDTPPSGEQTPPIPGQTGSQPAIDAGETNLQTLQEALRKLRSYASGPAVPAQMLTNPLLDVWEPAHQIHPWVALPVERFLTALLTRNLVAPAEIREVADEVSLLTLEMRSLAGHARRERGGPSTGFSSRNGPPV